MNHIKQQHENQISLSDLYQEVIVDHFKYPRFKGRILDCRFCQEGKNPLCGDVISIYCRVLSQNLLEVYFEGSGCSISQASASMMCELVQNKTVHDTKMAIQLAEEIYTGKQKVDPENMSSDLDAMSGIGQFPARVKCAALPWKTLECLIAENFDENGCPVAKSCEKHLSTLNQGRKLRIVTTEAGQ